MYGAVRATFRNDGALNFPSLEGVKGSFGGSRATALRVVAPTLARSAIFENISGVYLYATLVSAIPLYVSAVQRSARLAPVVRFFPEPIGPVAFALLIFAAEAICLTALATVFVRLQA